MPNKKTIVFIHGYASNGDTFKKLFHLLKPHYNCLTLDLPTVNSPHNLFNLDNLTQHTVKFIKSLPQSKINIVGLSLGGLVAINTTNQIPSKISKLMILNITPQPKLPLPYHLLLFTKNNFLLKCFSQVKFRTQKTGNILTLQQIIRRSLSGSLLEIYKQLKQPKQIILFKDDRLIRWRSNHKHLAKNHLKVVSFKNGGHATKPIYWPTIAQKIRTFI